jgi:hypothetical protein
VHALSEVFLKRIKASPAREALAGIPGADLAGLIDDLYAKPWVVYVKRPFAVPDQVLQYLGRYTHRVAISNARIKTVDEHQVSFACRDAKNEAKKITLTLDGSEFLRRFFLHMLPKGFTRIWHYGILGNAVRQTNIPLIRSLLDQTEPDALDETPIERLERVYGRDPRQILIAPRSSQLPSRMHHRNCLLSS